MGVGCVMTIEAQILAALASCALPSPVTATDLVLLQERVYQLRSGPEHFFIKWIADDDPKGLHELAINQVLVDQHQLATPRLLFTARCATGTVAGWEWLTGDDLRHQHRDWLPTAFAMLGRFHQAHRYDGPLVSPTTEQRFGTIRQLLDAELDFLGGWYIVEQDTIKARCREMWRTLEAGYPTLIHGDLHPGNLRLTAQGLFFVDWSYARQTLNFFDLDYVQSIRLPGETEQPWWLIPPTAAAVLPAYFAACGLAHLAPEPVHLAVMAWNELRNHYHGCQRYDAQQRQQAEVASREKVDYLYHAYRSR